MSVTPQMTLNGRYSVMRTEMLQKTVGVAKKLLGKVTGSDAH